MSIPISMILFLDEIELFLCEMIRQIRWAKGVYCPHCKSSRIIKWGRYGKFQRYRCKDCRRTFNDKSGTILDGSKHPLILWAGIIILLVILHTSERKISIFLSISFKSVFLISKKIMMKIQSSLPIPKGIEGEIEIDESYVTCGLKGRNNRHKIKQLGRKPRKRGLKRRGRGKYSTDRPPIISVVLRGGERLLFVAARATKRKIQSIIHQLDIRRGSTLFTDEYRIYAFLSSLFHHEFVNHSRKEYARGKAHVNSCEGEFALFKSFILIHKGVAKYNLPLYVALYRLHIKVGQMDLFEAFRYVMEVILSDEVNPQSTNNISK